MVKKRQKWSHQTVLAKIEELESRNVPLSAAYICKNYPALYGAALRYFGGWKQAILASGRDYDFITRYRRRSKEEILAKVRSLFANGEQLYSWYMRHQYPQLLDAGCHVFGSWKKTIEAAGIDYNLIRRYRVWTLDEIMADVVGIAERGEPLNSRYVQAYYAILYQAGCRICGSWSNTIKAYGMNYADVCVRQPGRSWTVAEVLHEMRLIAGRGEPLNSTYVQKFHRALLSAAQKRFGSWEAAVSALGIDYRDVCLTVRTKDVERSSRHKDATKSHTLLSFASRHKKVRRKKVTRRTN